MQNILLQLLKKPKKAFQEFVSEYPESISSVNPFFLTPFEQWINIYKSGKSQNEIIGDVLNALMRNKPQKTRQLKREHKKPNRDFMRKAGEIITFKHIPEWENNFGINKEAWTHLIYKYSKAIDEGLQYDEATKYMRCDSKVLLKLTDELLDSYNLNVRDYLSHFKFQIFLASFMVHIRLI